MTPRPTLHLRFIRRTVRTSIEGQQVAVAKTIKVLQQFWEHPDGDESVGDLFTTAVGSWRDVQTYGAKS